LHVHMTIGRSYERESDEPGPIPCAGSDSGSGPGPMPAVSTREDVSRLKIDFHGLFHSPMSWAHVARHMAAALDRIGCTVAVKAHRGFCYSPSFAVDPRLEALRARCPAGEIAVAFDYPLHYSRLEARFKVGLLVYESTRMPSAWVEAIERHLDLLVVPSRFCAAAALESGVSPQRLEIVPYGYDASLFRPGPGPRESRLTRRRAFVFLCVAMPHTRKGLAELLEAFAEEFGAKEPVRLLIKLPYLPKRGAAAKPWEIPDLAQDVARFSGAAAGQSRIALLVQALAPEAMPGLYGACHAYVQPSYGEGFGLSILEAKAMGLPTVVTGWGGHMDFCSEANSFLVDYDRVPAGSAQYDTGSSEAVMARPTIASLRRMMRTVYEDPLEAGVRIERSYRDIASLTWESAARSLAARLLERVSCDAPSYRRPF
jgi:glycosyltransferase involved in cell wall biosynthesis